MPIRTEITILTSVGGILIVTVQHCGQDLLTVMKAKNMDQEKEEENTSTQETVQEL